MAEVRVFDQAPGVVARCPACDQVLLRVVRRPGRAWLDLRGLTYLQLPVLDQAERHHWATRAAPGPASPPGLAGSAIDGLAGAGTMVHIALLGHPVGGDGDGSPGRSTRGPTPGVGGAASRAAARVQPVAARRPRAPHRGAAPGHRPGRRDVVLRAADLGAADRARRRRPGPDRAVRRSREDRAGPGRCHRAGPGGDQPAGDRRGGRPLLAGPAQPAARRRGPGRPAAHLVGGQPPVRRHQPRPGHRLPGPPPAPDLPPAADRPGLRVRLGGGRGVDPRHPG
jgi:hypothetical protein